MEEIKLVVEEKNDDVVINANETYIRGAQGERGTPGTVISTTEPTDKDIVLWINPDNELEVFTGDYYELKNKPYINNVELIGNKTLEDLGIKQEYTANDIKFSDNETFQEKYNKGELKGENGVNGVGVPEGGISGQILSKKSDTNYDFEWIDNIGSSSVSGGGDTLPIGTIVPYGSDVIPGGWLRCDGSIVEQSDYPELFSVIGTTYGYYGRTDFKLPDLQGRVAVGKNTVIDTENPDTDFNELGKYGGEKTHTLTRAEMPTHEHDVIGSINTNSGGERYYIIQQTGISDTQSGTIGTTVEAGGGEAHNNLQPYLVTNYIIKAKKTVSIKGEIIQETGTASMDNVYSAVAVDNKLKTNIVTGEETATNEYVDGKQVFIKKVEFIFPTTINEWATLIQLDSTVDDLIDKKLRYIAGGENYDFPYNFENEEITYYFNKNNKTLNVKTNFAYPGGKTGWGILKYTKN